MALSEAVVANLEVFAAIAATSVALLQAVIAALSYQRLRNPRALLIGAAFVVLVAQGIYLIVESVRTRGSEPWVLWVSLFELVTLMSLFFAIRNR